MNFLNMNRNAAKPLYPGLSGVFLAALLLCRAAAAGALDPAAYRRVFAGDYQEALAAAAEIRPLLLAALDGDGLLADIGVAVVFPELTRYFYLRDLMETTALEFSYLMGGSADFSIGKLQMKPSFAELLEADAAPRQRERYGELFVPAPDRRAARGARIQRLKNSARQLEYLALFLRILEEKFPAFAADEEEMIRVYSAAYNGGYHKSLEELRAASENRSFPYGVYYSGEQYCYTEIALDYYRSICYVNNE